MNPSELRAAARKARLVFVCVITTMACYIGDNSEFAFIRYMNAQLSSKSTQLQVSYVEVRCRWLFDQVCLKRGYV